MQYFLLLILLGVIVFFYMFNDREKFASLSFNTQNLIAEVSKLNKQLKLKGIETIKLEKPDGKTEDEYCKYLINTLSEKCVSNKINCNIPTCAPTTYKIHSPTTYKFPSPTTYKIPSPTIHAR